MASSLCVNEEAVGRGVVWGVCRSLIKASQERWMLSKVLKGTAASTFVQLLALYPPPIPFPLLGY